MPNTALATSTLPVSPGLPEQPPTQLGFGGTNPAQNAPVPQTAWSLSEERLKREKATSTGDYVSSIWKQDGLVDGLVANVVGNQMMPDENYSPFKDPNWADLTKGVWPDLVPNLYQAHSSAHAMYLRDRLLEKQEDLTKLGDLGWKGNVGRFALNAVLPDQLLMAMAGGWVARGAKAVQGARAARMATDATQLGKATAVAGEVAGEAARAASPAAMATGVAFGAAENAAYEKFRQSVNFEDDTAGVLEAGLMGAAFTAPFAYAGSRGARTVAAAAEKEHSVLRALKAVEDGAPLTPEQGKIIHEVHTAHTALRDFENGKIDEAGLTKAMDEFHGPMEPADKWMERYSSDIRAKGQSIIDELFPAPKDPLKAPEKAPVSEMPMSEAEKALALSKAGTSEAPTAMELAFKTAKDNAAASRLKRAKDNQQLREAFDMAEGPAKAEKQAAWKEAEKARQASIDADYNRMVNAREEARMLGQEDPLPVPKQETPSEAPAAPVEAPKPEVQATPAAHPHEAYVGRDVSWANADGETISGTVKSFNGDIGKLIVHTDEGMKAVRAETLDQFDGSAPSGFLPGSVGSAQVEKVQSIAGQRTAMAEMTIPGTTIKVPTRFDIYATLNASPVEGIRKLAYRLVKDAIQNDQFEAQSMTASEWKKQLQRTVTGRFHVVAGEAYAEAAKARNVPFWRAASFKEEFYGNVSRVTRGDNDVLMQHPDIAPMLQKAAQAQSQVYATLIDQAKKAGVKGAEDIEPNDFYVNRMWHHGNIRQAIELHGEEAVHKLIATSILNQKEMLAKLRQNNGVNEVRDTLTNTITQKGKTDEELLLKKATGFLKAVRELEFNPALREIHLAGRDMGTLRSELRSLGVSDRQADDLVDLMFEVRPQEADAGRAANLKFRFALDEAGSVVTPNGTLKLADLFENDARVLTDVYTNSMAGHVGLAKQGITSQAEWAQALKKVADEATEMGANGSQVARDMALLQDVHKMILGRPTNTDAFSYTARAAAAMRGYTRGVMLPQLGIAAAFEMNKAISMLGFKSLVQQLPSLRSLLVGMRQGFVPDKGLAKDIMMITGFGQEKAAAYHRGQEIENGFFGQTLTRAENGANKVSHTVDVLSGNASFTSLTKQLTGMMAVQNMHEHALGKKLPDSLKERWVGQGISHDDIDMVLGKLKEHSSHKDGVVQEVRYEDWLKDSPKSYEQFQTFLSRQVRDAIQDHDLGESMPFMHSTIGKIISELKTFFLVAHAKNFLKNMHYMDATSAQVWAIGFIGESLAYMTQTAVNYPHELEERLTPEKIATAAYFRMSALGTASMLTETGYNILSGGDSLVQPGMTANTDNRSFLKTPSVMVANRLANLPATGIGMVLGTDVTTKREARDLWGSFPGANLYGLKAAGQYWINTMPSYDPSKAYTP